MKLLCCLYLTTTKAFEHLNQSLRSLICVFFHLCYLRFQSISSTNITATIVAEAKIIMFLDILHETLFVSHAN